MRSDKQYLSLRLRRINTSRPDHLLALPLPDEWVDVVPWEVVAAFACFAFAHGREQADWKPVW